MGYSITTKLKKKRTQFAQRVLNKAEHAGMTLSDVAKTTGLSEQDLKKYRFGTSWPRYSGSVECLERLEGSLKNGAAPEAERRPKTPTMMVFKDEKTIVLVAPKDWKLVRVE